MNIAAWLTQTQKAFASAGILTARLDALVLLSDVLAQNKAWILAHGDEPLTSKQCATLEALTARRLQREPLAYIRGHAEFYGRAFKVTPTVLIPRPESEALIDQLKNLSPLAGQSLLDVGTGSGVLAITAALETPLAVTACDISQPALAVARHNATRLGARVTFLQSDLLTNAPCQFDFIVANLPYVDRSWERSPETNFEPTQALFAADNGLALIKKLLAQAPTHLTPNGYILLEADPRQHATIMQIAKHIGFAKQQAHEFVVVVSL